MPQEGVLRLVVDRARQRVSFAITADSGDEDPAHRALIKRQSWNEPANMSREEASAANELLLVRLKPFMTMPTTNAPLTVFFFNKDRSTAKSVTTDESGHFNLRAALDFVPEQVRVLASEKTFCSGGCTHHGRQRGEHDQRH